MKHKSKTNRLGKKLFSLIIAVCFIFISSAPTRAHAQFLPFAGIVSFPITCTCTVGILWTWFTPLYLGGPVIFTGPLAYSAYTTFPFANYRVNVPSAYHMGDYIPGVQACWMYAGFFCFPLPVIGLINKVGTN